MAPFSAANGPWKLQISTPNNHQRQRNPIRYPAKFPMLSCITNNKMHIIMEMTAKTTAKASSPLHSVLAHGGIAASMQIIDAKSTTASGFERS
mmetsp:Transcript_5449/g.6365  ORF Transcript_5449/g.6365 Transcript_5449/m.6365 type:complete len:93 (-) Transcript_5449:747-1025(-)